MNTRSRITLSTIFGVALAGFCLGSAQAQSHEDMDMVDSNGMVKDWLIKQPAPINYPMAAPGGVDLYHYTDYTRESLSEGSAQSKRMDNMYMMLKHRHEREKMHRGGYMTDENGMTMEEEMKDPAPIGYPFAAPGGLHLYHWTDYTHEGLSEGTRTSKKMDNNEKMTKRMSEHDKMYKGRYLVDEDGMTVGEEMREPAPIGYPFAAPGGVHLYHWNDYTEEGLEEGTRTSKKMEKEEKMEKKRLERTKGR